MRIALYQMEDQGDASKNIKLAYQAIKSAEADFFVLPEFFSVPGGDFRKNYTLEECWRKVGRPALEMLQKASIEFKGYLIGGTTLEKTGEAFYNTCFVFRGGREIAKYRKIHLTEEEERFGILSGRKTTTFETEHARVGLLICADSIYEETCDEVASRVDVVFLPISLTNPNHPKVQGHPLSCQMARKHRVIVVKVSRVGIFGGKKLISPSAVIAPLGILYEGGEEEELAVVEANLC